MVNRKFYLLLAASLAATGCAKQSTPAAATVPVRPEVSAPFAELDARRILTALAHDSMEGRRTGSRGAAMSAAFIAAEMKAIGLEPAGDSAYFQMVPFATGGQRGIQLLDSVGALASVPESDRIIGYNVIGIIRGSDPLMRDEVVLIGAHYDHVGIGKPVDGDSIYNGADDDASGVTAVLGIARMIAAGPPPKRTMVFMTSTGEEQGILGA